MNWHATYEPLLGRELEGIAFLPITGDTALVLSHLEQSHHWFSGAVCVGLSGADDLFLTWHLQRQVLQATDSLEWNRFALDRITASAGAPWDILNRATLDSVHFFSDKAQPSDDIIAARHDFRTAQDIASFWVCTGNAPMGYVGEGDDLFVGLDAPQNLADLDARHTIGRDSRSRDDERPTSIRNPRRSDR